MELYPHEVEYLNKAFAWMEASPDNLENNLLGFYVSKVEIRDADGNVYGYIEDPDGTSWHFVSAGAGNG